MSGSAGQSNGSGCDSIRSSAESRKASPPFDSNTPVCDQNGMDCVPPTDAVNAFIWSRLLLALVSGARNVIIASSFWLMCAK